MPAALERSGTVGGYRHDASVTRTNGRRTGKLAPPKICYFCGRVGNMSKEHVWPQWMRKGALVQPTQVTSILGVAQTGPTELTENTNVVTHKNASVLTTHIREVCADCNNGWMSQLETDVQPLIRRLVVRSYPFGVTTLAPKEAATLSAWAVKTAWMRERATPASNSEHGGRILPGVEHYNHQHSSQHVVRTATQSLGQIMPKEDE